MKLYIMGDLHGQYRAFYQRLDQLGNLCTITDEGTEDMLILLGDYIDGPGGQSGILLEKIYALQTCFPDRVIVLRGNHEQMLLEWLETYLGPESESTDEYGLPNWSDWLNTDPDMETFRSLISREQWDFFQKIAPTLSEESMNREAARMVSSHHEWLLGWLKSLPFYYQTEKQIFVHAGIDEEAEDWWEWGTPESMFIGKFPPTTGKFYKDIIAGHVGTGRLKNDRNFHDILWDGASHFFCDGSVQFSGQVPVLVYDCDTDKYYSLGPDVPSSQRKRNVVRGELLTVSQGVEFDESLRF